ncbi:MAG: hypothetical protein ABIO70_23285 [Pseudomonadota bacterium]
MTTPPNRYDLDNDDIVLTESDLVFDGEVTDPGLLPPFPAMQIPIDASPGFGTQDLAWTHDPADTESASGSARGARNPARRGRLLLILGGVALPLAAGVALLLAGPRGEPMVAAPEPPDHCALFDAAEGEARIAAATAVQPGERCWNLARISLEEQAPPPIAIVQRPPSVRHGGKKPKAPIANDSSPPDPDPAERALEPKDSREIQKLVRRASDPDERNVIAKEIKEGIAAAWPSEKPGVTASKDNLRAQIEELVKCGPHIDLDAAQDNLPGAARCLQRIVARGNFEAVYSREEIIALGSVAYMVGEQGADLLRRASVSGDLRALAVSRRYLEVASAWEGRFKDGEDPWAEQIHGPWNPNLESLTARALDAALKLDPKDRRARLEDIKQAAPQSGATYKRTQAALLELAENQRTIASSS